ncbi:metallophosphoesterase [Spirosoma arcticum]
MRSVPYLSVIFLFLTAGIVSAQTPTLVRGPYLQVVTPTSVTVRWRTSQPTTGRVWTGPTTAQLTGSQRETQPALDHSLTLTGLQPATRYAYAIGYDETQLTSGPDYYVQTAPPTGDTRPFRLWVLGDFGFGNDNQRAVYQAYRTATSNRPADLWLWLGDNAYCCGFDDQFQRYVFDVYGSTFRNTPFYPTPGNHDYADSRTNFDITYYKLFSVPKQGEAGGVASNSSAYFSADYGNVHLISLDSQAQQPDDQKRLYDTTGTQVQWLKRDLAANRLPWTLVIFHHPPYSKGSHDSDTEEQMRLLRENLTPIFERYGVDLVMNGHSHNYERYYRLKNQTGLANTFDPAKHIAEATTARYDGSPNSCPILTKGQGTVYVVNGSGGALGGVSPGYPHGGMAAGYRGDIWGGSMLLDVTDNRLDAQFIAYDGSVQDKFTLMKAVNKVASLTAEFADTLQISASWVGDYRWMDSQTSRSIRYVADKSGTFPVTVSDAQQCLTDQFTVLVLPQPVLTTRTSASVCAGGTLAVTATPENTTKAAGWQYDVLLSDASGSFSAGRVIGSGTLTALNATLPASLPAGTGYRLRVRPRGIAYAQLVPSEPIAVKLPATATLTGSASVLAGEPASLTLTFTGEGPWRGTLSTGTTFSATTSPTVVSVQPSQTTSYSVATVENSCGSGTSTGQAMITVLLPTEIAPFAGGYLHIYPNPAKDVIYVTLSTGQKKETNLRLHDGQGRLVYQKKFNSSTLAEEAVPMPDRIGTYLLTVQVGQQTITRKVVRE